MSDKTYQSPTAQRNISTELFRNMEILLQQQNETLNHLQQLRNSVADIHDALEIVPVSTSLPYDGAKDPANLKTLEAYPVPDATPDTLYTHRPTVNILLIVGHNPIVQGAYSDHLQQSEYDYNLSLARKLEGSNVILDHATRTATTINTHITYRTHNETRATFTRDIVVPFLDRNSIHFIIELHFNAFANQQANGSELLHTLPPSHQPLLNTFYNEFSRNYPDTRKRGLKHVMPSNRGYTNLTRLRKTHNITTPICIMEPFFGSNEQDCNNATLHLYSAYRAAIEAVGMEIATQLTSS